MSKAGPAGIWVVWPGCAVCRRPGGPACAVCQVLRPGGAVCPICDVLGAGSPKKKRGRVMVELASGP